MTQESDTPPSAREPVAQVDERVVKARDEDQRREHDGQYEEKPRISLDHRVGRVFGDLAHALFHVWRCNKGRFRRRGGGKQRNGQCERRGQERGQGSRAHVVRDALRR
jgi:hypothetical protein